MRRRSIALAVCSVLLLSFVALPASAAGPGSGSATVSPGRALRRTVEPRAPRPAPDALSRAVASGRISHATYAFERARSLVDLAGVRARYGDVARPDPREATLDLRDLIRAYDELSPSQRAIARALLARPTDNKPNDPAIAKYSVPETTPHCTSNACFHWVTSTSDAPNPFDGPDAGTLPDYVDEVVATFDTVWDTEISDFGFRPPKSDATSSNHGPNGNIDVYLADIGGKGFYGYCTSDDPHDFGGGYRFWDASAYCVIDDDFSPAQFPGASGVDALEVTLAHEFFHAVQFAYDAFEDRWWMEATATWIEDEVFDDVDDNLQYLSVSPITKPGTPLDSNGSQFLVYGDWIFFRFVSELFGSGGNHDVSVIKHAWELADGAKGGPDKYSLRAVAGATKSAGLPFRQVFALFGLANDVAPAAYDEGTANHYPTATLAHDPIRITKRRDTRSGSFVRRHLTNTYVEFTPGRGVTASAHLVVRLNLPATAAGSAATAAVIDDGGGATFAQANLSSDGNGKLRLNFGRGTIAAVDLVMTNASTRTRCWVDRRFRYSCAGNPKDDGLTYRFKATLKQ